MQLFVVAAHLANDDYDKAVVVAEVMEPGADRDSALLEIAEKIVPRRLTMSLEVLPTEADQRASLSQNLARLVDLAKRASNAELSARLLVRAAILKRAMDKTQKTAAPTDPRLNPDELLSAVNALARKAPRTVSRMPSGAGSTIVLTALLGMLGFALSQLVQPVLQVVGSIVAGHVSGSIHPLLPGLFKGVHDQVTGGVHPEKTAQAPGSQKRNPTEAG